MQIWSRSHSCTEKDDFIRTFTSPFVRSQNTGNSLRSLDVVAASAAASSSVVVVVVAAAVATYPFLLPYPFHRPFPFPFPFLPFGPSDAVAAFHNPLAAIKAKLVHRNRVRATHVPVAFHNSSGAPVDPIERRGQTLRPQTNYTNHSQQRN